jgi:hypothetical protein
LTACDVHLYVHIIPKGFASCDRLTHGGHRAATS